MIDLRSYVFLDQLQPQFTAFIATVAQGFLPVAKMASLFVEISPGIEINRITDIALKNTRVTPGMQIVERLYGMLEIHSESQAEVRAAKRSTLGWTAYQLADRIALREFRAHQGRWKRYRDSDARQGALSRFHEYAYQWY